MTLFPPVNLSQPSSYSTSLDNLRYLPLDNVIKPFSVKLTIDLTEEDMLTRATFKELIQEKQVGGVKPNYLLCFFRERHNNEDVYHHRIADGQALKDWRAFNRDSSPFLPEADITERYWYVLESENDTKFTFLCRDWGGHTINLSIKYLLKYSNTNDPYQGVLDCLKELAHACLLFRELNSTKIDYPSFVSILRSLSDKDNIEVAKGVIRTRVLGWLTCEEVYHYAKVAALSGDFLGHTTLLEHLDHAECSEESFALVNTLVQKFFEDDFAIAVTDCLADLLKLHEHFSSHVPKKVFEIYKKSESTEWLGWCYLKGYGTDHDIVMAFKMFEKSPTTIKTINLESDLKVIILNMINVSFLKAEAFQALNLAATEVNSPDPLWMSLLGYCHEFGVGTKLNLDEAKKWYQTACEQDDGCPLAFERLKELSPIANHTSKRMKIAN